VPDERRVPDGLRCCAQPISVTVPAGLFDDADDGSPRGARRCQLHARILVGENRDRTRETAVAAIERYDATSAVRGRPPGAAPIAGEPGYDWDAMAAAGRNIYGTP